MAAVGLCSTALAVPSQARYGCSIQPATSIPGSLALRRHAPYHQASSSSRGALVVRAAGPGGNVIDRPSVLPGLNKGKEAKHRKPPIYRVLLHNDNYNRREYVVGVLLRTIDGFTPEDAVNCMQEAHINGIALVTMCAQEVAERYVEQLRMNGLISTLEPGGPSN